MTAGDTTPQRLLGRLLEHSRLTASFRIDEGGIVTDPNPALALHLGIPNLPTARTPLADLLSPHERERVSEWLKGGSLPSGSTWINFVTASGSALTLRCLIDRSESGIHIVAEPEVEDERARAETMSNLNNELATMLRERTRHEIALERMQTELQATLDEIRATSRDPSDGPGPGTG